MSKVIAFWNDERGTETLEWGLVCGLIVVGAVLVFLRAELPARLADLFELLVAIMLIVLGTRAVAQAWTQGQPSHLHPHTFAVHQHSGLPAHVHIGTWTLARRPLIIGAMILALLAAARDPNSANGMNAANAAIVGALVGGCGAGAAQPLPNIKMTAKMRIEKR